MDGSSKDKKVNGALFRPVNLLQALDQFTPLIYDMVMRKTRIMPNSASDGIFAVLVYGMEGRFWTLRTEDYEKCLNIVRKFSTPLAFQSQNVIIEQIKAYITAEFSER